ARDQDHIPVLTYTLPQVPDRNDAILHGGESPLATMQAGVRLLAGAGVSALAIPCNTAHYWTDDLRSVSPGLPLLGMVEAVARRLERLEVRGKVALLATEATAKAGIYGRVLEPLGYKLIAPGDEAQDAIDHAVKRVKAGDLYGAGEPVLRVL